MSSTLIASLFLPKTVSFPEPPKKSTGRVQPFKLHQRASSNLLVSRASELSLFEGNRHPSPASTPEGHRDFFIDNVEVQGSQPSTLLSQSHMVDWVGETRYNQPRSRAALLPSDSIIAVSNYMEQKQYQKERYPLRFTKSIGDKPSARLYLSREDSSEREFADQSWQAVAAIHGNGGLINAMRKGGGGDAETDPTWIGTIGFPVDSLTEDTKHQIYDQMQNEYQSKVVYCSDKDIEGHYKHYCKVVLWPIFHYQVPDHAKSKAYEDHSWDFYERVNQAFAEQVVASYKKGDTIWIHDYHLLLVPRMVRNKLPDAKIGFFLHTAFPSVEIFRCLAKKKELLLGMLGANLIGFQCKEYVEHFLSTCAQLLAVESLATGVQLDDRFVNVTSQPIGINPSLFEDALQNEEVTGWIEELAKKYKDKHIIVARDKLDAVHGVRQKLLTYEAFLRSHPELVEKVVMIQIATSTTEQPELAATVSDIVSRIDALYSSLQHQPLVFLRQDLGFHAYLALLAMSDVLMISALRDGMCLTVHEFAFCQNGRYGPKKHGPVILSEFTGTAAVLESVYSQKTLPTHLSINPWDNTGMCKAIKKALFMPDDEKEAQWRRLHGVVTAQTGASWHQKLQQALDTAYDEQHQRASVAVPRLKVPQLCGQYTDSRRRVLIVDYEGTLAPHQTASGFQPGSASRMIDTFRELLADSTNIVYVMSGRTPDELENAFRQVPEIGLIAENGGYIHSFGSRSFDWDVFVDEAKVREWKKDVMPMLQYYRERLEGSAIEERRCSLIFRYDKCQDQENAKGLASQCAAQVNEALKSRSIRAVPVTKAVLIEMQDFSKGTAAARIFTQCQMQARKHGLSPIDFLMVAGDDREDEVVFRWANRCGESGEVPHVFTVTVGKRNTEAHATLEQGATSLLNVLGKLAKISADGSPLAGATGSARL